MKPSATMLDALRHAEHEPLIRVPGGFWTTQSTPLDQERFTPTWSVGVGTIRAMMKRGWLMWNSADPAGTWCAPRYITNTGLAVLRNASKETP